MGSKKRQDRAEFYPEYEGEELLGALLAGAGAVMTVDQLIEEMRAAIEAGERPGDFIPTIFEGEPRFADPSQAQVTFQNLLGLWGLLSSGEPLPKKKAERPPKPKKPEPVHPGPFEEAGPDLEWVERAWKYLDDLGEKGRTPLVHAFENRQDALITWLDDSGLSDDGYLVARHLSFELHAMIELGWSAGVLSVDPGRDFKSGDARQAPPALLAYVDEALFEAEQDDEAPFPPEEATKVRETVERCLFALWSARRPHKSG